MRHRAAVAAKLLAICGALALGGLGCGTARPDYVGGRKGEPPDLLVRSFLVEGKDVEGYGYYAYLVFTENSEATRARREAAVHAFINLFTDVRYLEPDRDRPARMAVLYAPVTQDWRGPDAGAEGVLQAYDYLFAQRVAVQLARHRSIPPVFLLASPAPVQKALSAGVADLWVVELKGDRQAIESTLTGFRDRLLSPDKPSSGREMLERVLGFFDSVGGFVIAIATLGGGTSPSKP